MTVGMERYTELLNKFGEISQEYIKSDDLMILKLDYEDIIQSKRVLESIVDIKSLLKVLEKRGILQYDEINVLKKIAEQFVNDASINHLITNYEQWFNVNSPMINNFYSCAIVPKTDPVTKISENQNKSKMPYFASNINIGLSTESRFTMNQSHYSTSTPLPDLDRQEELQNLIVSRISPRVGQSWIDISRGLGIQNSRIDEIEMKFYNKPYDYENMFKEAIRFYFSEHPSNWKIDLMQALQNFARRKDLKETVEKLLIS